MGVPRKERIVRATFGDGRVIERGSVNRIYTHAWRVVGTWTDEQRALRLNRPEWTSESGFASSADNANRAMQSVKNNWLHSTSFISVSGEVVAVVEIANRGEAA